MHEVAIAQGVLNLAIKTARQSGAARIHRIRMRVGAMSGVVPDSLSFAFEALREGTMAAEAELAIEAIPSVGWCAGCQAEFTAEGFALECPRCHAYSRELRRGRELEMADMEVS
jgi:hydrogenase nickel incorporation protein HypA/HybF